MISIIIPVFKAEQYLRDCIDSVLAQTYTNWELLLVDDGSPDKSGEICDEYAAKDSRIQVLHKSNEGVGAARNAGIEIAIGDKLCFIDADDTVEPNYLESFIRAEENDLVVCGYLVDKYDIENRLYCTERYSYDNLKFQDGDNKGVLEGAFASGIMHINCNKLYNFDIIRKYNIRYKSYPVNEDFIFVLSYLLHCKSLAFIDNCTYHWIRRNGLTSGVESIPDDIISIYEESHKLLADYLHDDTIADRVMYRSYEMLIYKFFYAYKNKSIDKDTCFSHLQRMHASNLANRTLIVANAPTVFTKFVCVLHRVGWFKLSFLLHKHLIWR